MFSHCELIVSRALSWAVSVDWIFAHVLSESRFIRASSTRKDPDGIAHSDLTVASQRAAEGCDHCSCDAPESTTESLEFKTRTDMVRNVEIRPAAQKRPACRWLEDCYLDLATRNRICVSPRGISVYVVLLPRVGPPQSTGICVNGCTNFRETASHSQPGADFARHGTRCFSAPRGIAVRGMVPPPSSDAGSSCHPIWRTASNGSACASLPLDERTT